MSSYSDFLIPVGITIIAALGAFFYIQAHLRYKIVAELLGNMERQKKMLQDMERSIAEANNEVSRKWKEMLETQVSVYHLLKLSDALPGGALFKATLNKT